MQPDAGASAEARFLANGRYRLLDELAAGGLFEVWTARDGLLDCKRLIKLLAKGMADRPRVRQRFENEARAMARLAHPNIAMVHDIGEEAGQPYVVVELLEGGTVMDWIGRHGPMPARLACDVLIQVLDALQAAHGQGVAHRDLTPRNVLLSATGVPKVTDFGLGQLRASVEGALLGSAGAQASVYQAPEQHDGAPGDSLSDVYAAGVTLLVMVTGLDQAVTEASIHALPEALAAVVRTATSADPALRWTSPGEMALALRGAQAGLEPVPDTTPALGGALEPARPLDPHEPEGTLRPVRAVRTMVDDRGTVPNAPTREASSRRTSTLEPVKMAGRTAAPAPFLEIPEAPPVAFVVVPPRRPAAPPVRAPVALPVPPPVAAPAAVVEPAPVPAWLRVAVPAVILLGVALLVGLALSG